LFALFGALHSMGIDDYNDCGFNGDSCIEEMMKNASICPLLDI